MLTLFPVRVARFDPEMLARAPLYFPCVGALIGAALWASHALLDRAMPDVVEGVLLAALSVGLTGGLHQDALGDTLDGLAGGRSRDDTLRIMDDPRTGSLGATGIAISLLLRASCLTALAGTHLGPSAVAACVFGRTLQVAALCLRPARNAGLGHACAQPLDLRRIALCTLGAVVAPLMLIGAGAMVAIAAGAVPAGLIVRAAHRRIGGMTGDVCGAAGEIGEVGFLVGCAAVLVDSTGAAV
jgi:adenosylcobinamide-GDP ribazoletransferase